MVLLWTKIRGNRGLADELDEQDSQYYRRLKEQLQSTSFMSKYLIFYNYLHIESLSINRTTYELQTINYLGIFVAKFSFHEGIQIWRGLG